MKKIIFLVASLGLFCAFSAHAACTCDKASKTCTCANKNFKCSSTICGNGACLACSEGQENCCVSGECTCVATGTCPNSLTNCRCAKNSCSCSDGTNFTNCSQQISCSTNQDCSKLHCRAGAKAICRIVEGGSGTCTCPASPTP